MAGPSLTIAGKQLTFGTDGGVTDNAGASQGTWTTEQDNKVHYTIQGVNQDALNAAWSFDANNVLSAAFSTADKSATSGSFAFQGGIEIDDATHLIYFIVDNTGAKTGFKITLTGTISLTADSSNLSVALGGGTTVQITGASDQQILSAAQNTVADFNAQDLLNFAAVTNNPTAQADVVLPVPAQINFAGSWDLKNGLVFVSQVRVPAGGPATIDIAFAGNLKGVTVGFAYFSGADTSDDSQMAFSISGQHVFNSGTLDWSSSIGFTGKSFNASVEIDDKQTIGDNNKLTITGKLNLTDTAGGPLKLDLSLSAEYDIDKNGILKFTADVDDNSPTPSYDLKLTGSYKYTSGLTLTFSIDYTDKGGAPALTANIGIQGDQNSIIKNLSLILDITPAAAQLQLTLNFSMKLSFVDGVRVNQPAVQQAAQGNQPLNPAPAQQPA